MWPGSRKKRSRPSQHGFSGFYDIQVAAHEAAVAALRPGIPFVDVYELSCKVIMEGLKDLGFVKGDPMEAVKAGAHAMFMPCGLGHMMGLDVHDMENLGPRHYFFINNLVSFLQVSLFFIKKMELMLHKIIPLKYKKYF